MLEERVLTPEWRKKYCLFDMSWPDVKEWLEKTDTVLVPIGSCEQHGLHCPLGTDSYETLVVATQACERADVPMAPLIWSGVNPYHMGKPGTITLRAETFVNMVYDVCRSLIHHGFNKIVCCNTHHANHPGINQVARMIRYHTRALVVNYPVGMLLMEMGKGLYKAPPEEMPQWHAAELETSGVMAWNPSLVRLERARKEMPKNPAWMPKRWQKESGSASSIVIDGYDIWIPFDHYEYSESGAVGNPLNASEEQGNKIFSRAVEHLSRIILDIKEIRLEVKNREFWEA